MERWEISRSIKREEKEWGEEVQKCPEIWDRMGRTYFDANEVKNIILFCQKSQHPQRVRYHSWHTNIPVCSLKPTTSNQVCTALYSNQLSHTKQDNKSKESTSTKDEASQLTWPQYRYVDSNKSLQIKYAPHSSQTNYHTPSKAKSQTTGGKQGERRLYRKMGDFKIQRVFYQAIKYFKWFALSVGVIEEESVGSSDVEGAEEFIEQVNGCAIQIAWHCNIFGVRNKVTRPMRCRDSTD